MLPIATHVPQPTRHAKFMTMQISSECTVASRYPSDWSMVSRGFCFVTSNARIAKKKIPINIRQAQYCPQHFTI